jgi:hypothetical protein
MKTASSYLTKIRNGEEAVTRTLAEDEALIGFLGIKRHSYQTFKKFSGFN